MRSSPAHTRTRTLQDHLGSHQESHPHSVHVLTPNLLFLQVFAILLATQERPSAFEADPGGELAKLSVPVGEDGMNETETDGVYFTEGRSPLPLSLLSPRYSVDPYLRMLLLILAYVACTYARTRGGRGLHGMTQPMTTSMGGFASITTCSNSSQPASLV